MAKATRYQVTTYDKVTGQIVGITHGAYPLAEARRIADMSDEYASRNPTKLVDVVVPR